MGEVYIGVVYMTHPKDGDVDDELRTEVITMDEEELSIEAMEKYAPGHYTWCLQRSQPAAKNWLRRYCQRLMNTNSRVVVHRNPVAMPARSR